MFRGYNIQRLDGYYQGRPSWLKYTFAWSKEHAEKLVAELQKDHPTWKLRIRVRPKRR